MNLNVITPETTEELLEAIAKNQGNKFRFGAGYTDMILELKKDPVEELTVINLAMLHGEAFTSMEKHDNGIRIGALVTANSIVRDDLLHKHFPVLCKAAIQHGSRQIRQVATVGGNLCTASPAGDMACALVALQAQCEILSANGDVRSIPINKFFVDYRKTDLKKDEVLRSILVPMNNGGKKIHSDFIKIGTRRSMECAVVSLAYHFQAEANSVITRAGIAIGSAAPTIPFVQSACKYLIGKKLSEIDRSASEEFASKVVNYASPISDIRASAWYRQEVLFNISKSIFE
jgi:CO/xanthine dehydrogenase FAD-binding subunit